MSSLSQQTRNNTMSYLPVKLGYVEYEPINDSDESLSPVIFSHGYACTKEMWNDIPQIIADATKRKVYSIDTRNHGDSQYADEFNIDMTVVDFYNFMDTKNISKAILIGHSMGGHTMTRIALKTPHRVELLIVEDIGIKKLPREMLYEAECGGHLWEKAAQKIKPKTDIKEATKQMVDELFKSVPLHSQIFFGRRENLYDTSFNLIQNKDGRYALKMNLLPIIKASKHVETFSKHPQGLYTGPVLFICGNLSPFKVKVEKEEEEIRKHFPAAEIQIVDDASHIVHIDQPNKFATSVVKFIFQNSGL